MNEHPMAELGRMMAYREQYGETPEVEYTPTPEDFMEQEADPEGYAATMRLVAENDAHENATKRERRLMRQNAALKNILEENNIEVPEGL